MKDAVEKARGERKMFRRHTIVFVDEIHRFKKNQQVS
jgi:replication-associated recombination protein RarA